MKDIFDSWLVNKYIAHRGLHNNENPENSLGAFEHAIKSGYAIEFDVRQIEDGTPIVFHDVKLSRMTGQDGYVNNLKKEQLKDFYLKGTKHTIPTLEETLKLVGGKTPLLIEIKNNFKPGNFEKNVLELLKNYKGKFAVCSFNPYVLNWFKRNASEFLRGQTSSYFKTKHINPVSKMLLKRLRLNYLSSPHFISYDCRNLPNRYVKRYKNLPLMAWTVKTQEEYDRLKKYVDNIIFEDFKPKI